MVPCLTTLVSMYGGDDQKGTIMGVFRSLGALARALGPVVASTGRILELLRGLDKRWYLVLSYFRQFFVKNF